MTTLSADAKLGRMLLELDAPVARIVLRRAPLNVIDVAMMEELAHSLAEIEAMAQENIFRSGAATGEAISPESVPGHNFPHRCASTT